LIDNPLSGESLQAGGVCWWLLEWVIEVQGFLWKKDQWQTSGTPEVLFVLLRNLPISLNLLRFCRHLP